MSHTKIHLINPLTILIVLLISISFNACRKKELGENLLGELKNQNPFDGTEVLLYIDDDNDTTTFIGNGRFSEIFHYKPTHDKDNYYVNERDVCYFISQEGSYELMIYMSSFIASGAELTLSLIKSNSSNIQECKSYTSQFALPIINYYEDTRFLIDSMMVNSSYYYNVLVDSSLLHQSQPGGDCYTTNLPISIFYTISHGIIKINFEDGTKWELVKIL